MRPPVCALCDEALDPQQAGGTVSFRRRPSDDQWYHRSQQEPGFVGHPPNVEWFCGAHIDAARKLSHLPIDEAMRRLRQ